MFISVSKIQFESKSQLLLDLSELIPRCLSVCQRYNLKANHNCNSPVDNCYKGVYQCVKDTIWKQITTGSRFNWLKSWVFISVSKIQFESKSQPGRGVMLCPVWCLSVCQRYNLKANHNLISKEERKELGVYQCVKDTIWKQITTTILMDRE